LQEKREGDCDEVKELSKLSALRIYAREKVNKLKGREISLGHGNHIFDVDDNIREIIRR
jgi:hypothetical protein